METLHNQEWFKKQSLDLLHQQVSTQTYPGYPQFKDRLRGEPDSPDVMEALSAVDGPAYAKPYKEIAIPPEGRPLHPWFEDMVRRQDVGAALGNGFYWYYGANPTADSIPIRHDLDEPHVLLIERKDTGNVALSGGFCNKNEDPLETAYRENNEEVGTKIFNLRSVAHSILKVYHGDLADIRATAHAWPVTTAYLFNIVGKVNTPMEWRGNPKEVNRVFWQPVSELDSMFGSHKLLAQLGVSATAGLRA